MIVGLGIGGRDIRWIWSVVLRDSIYPNVKMSRSDVVEIDYIYRVL